ncbi:MAG: ABC transporter substrate-binding protein, partial [Lachnospiraceae bacterium]|nr:ABC transporter substrate-binding protein [Lachnospiraceae bacterium]
MRSNQITRRDFLKGSAAIAIGGLTMTSLGLSVYAEESGQKVLTFGWPYEPATLDPARTTEDAGYRTLRLAGESLLRNVSDEAEPGCAESYETNDDYTEYTFHLREDSVFSDGTAITSADFEYSLLRLLDPEGAYEEASAAYIIKNAEAYYNGECEASELGIEVPDDYTLKLT